ncbi:hypothetical protein SUGI_0498110 [Cryptomeria japonica]|nr:hypothetical protein SUGI_0498110 [Cryptomeria japonica]
MARSLYIAGNKLSDLFQSRDEAFKTLYKVEESLNLLEQSPHDLMQTAMLPAMATLKQHRWLKNPDGEIRLLVTTSLMEIIRISTPQEPYEDNIMKEGKDKLQSSGDEGKNAGENSVLIHEEQVETITFDIGHARRKQDDYFQEAKDVVMEAESLAIGERHTKLFGGDLQIIIDKTCE